MDPVQWLMVLNGGSTEFQNFEYPALFMLCCKFVYYHVNSISPECTLLLLVGINIHVLFALWVEKLLAQEQINPLKAFFMHVTNLVLILGIPILSNLVWGSMLTLMGSSVSCTLYTITFLKLWSYAHVNYWCRSVQDRSTLQCNRRRALSVNNLSKAIFRFSVLR